MKLRTTPLTLALLLATAGAQAALADASPARTPRGQAVHDLVMKWAPHVQETYGVAPIDWVGDMATTFANADLQALSAAAGARSFDEMNQHLLATAPGQRELAEALARAPSTDALGDVATDLGFVPVTPCRIIDTRVAGGAIPANTARDFDVSSTANYTAQGGSATDCEVGGVGEFAAAVVNFTVVTPGAAGYITAFPYNAGQPLASTVNYTAGDIRGNLATVRLDISGASAEMSVYSFAQTHLVADIVGYFTNPAATALNCVNTSVSSFSLAANATNFFNNPACPAGYTATEPYCWTAASGVYSQGSGFNANAAGNQTFCAWQNTTGASQTVFGGNVCCRVPGR